MRYKVALAVIGVSLLSVAGRLPGSGAAEPSQVYVAMGDSLTQMGSDTNQRYPERFFGVLQQRGAADALSNITFRVHVTDPLGATDTDDVVVTVRSK